MIFLSAYDVKRIRKARPCGEWCGLRSIDIDERPWLMEAPPDVAERIGITPEKYEQACGEQAEVIREWNYG